MSQEEVIHKLTVSMKDAQSMIETFIPMKLVPMVHGSPAIGKSSIVHELAEKHNLFLIDLRLSQCDPTDLLGFPQIIAAINRAGYTPMETFPIAGDGFPAKLNPDGSTLTINGKVQFYSGWILFLDEFNSAVRETQAAAYKIVLDRMVGKYHLHEKVAVICAGNLDTDGAITEQMSTALQSRLVHIDVAVNKNDWVRWAAAKNFDHRILSFIEFKPDLIYSFKPDHTDRTYSSPRTWEFTNRVLNKVDVKNPLALPMIAGCITEGIAREFVNFCEIVDKLPKIADIIIAPTSVRVSDEPSILFAISGSLAHHADKGNIADLIKYILRMPVEFQIVCMRMMMARSTTLLAEKCMQDWMNKHATELF